MAQSKKRYVTSGKPSCGCEHKHRGEGHVEHINTSAGIVSIHTDDDPHDFDYNNVAHIVSGFGTQERIRAHNPYKNQGLSQQVSTYRMQKVAERSLTSTTDESKKKEPNTKAQMMNRMWR